MSSEDNDLSGSESENDQQERNLTSSNVKEAYMSDGLSIENNSLSDNENKPSNSNYSNKDSSENENSNNASVEEEAPKPAKKKRGKKKKDRSNEETFRENDDDEREKDKEVEDLVKRVTKGRTPVYEKVDEKDDELQKRVEKILKGMKNALKQDEESYKNHKPPFARIKAIKDLQKSLLDAKVAKALLNEKLLDYLAAWISPYELRDDETTPTYPNIGFRTDILKMLLTLNVKSKHLEDKKTNIINTLQAMPVEAGSELSRLIKQVFDKFLRIIARADKNDDGDERASNSLDKGELYELKSSVKTEFDPTYVNKMERMIEKKAQSLRRSNAIQRPRDWKPPPRIVNSNIRPSKKRIP